MQLDHLIRYAEFLSNVPNLSDLDIHGYDIREDQTLPELLKHIYEWEYKYSIIQSYNIPDQRKTAMLTKIEDKITPCIDVVANVLKETYENWLQYHDTSDPDKCAQKWMSDHEYFGDSDEAQLASMWTSYNSHVYENEFKKITDLDYAVCDDEHIINDYKQLIADDMNQNLEEGEPEYTADSVDLEDWTVDTMTFIGYIMDCGYSIYDIVSGMYKRVIMPAWYGEWEYQGLDEFVESNNNILAELSSIPSQNFSQKLATLSIALNGMHLNGSMLQHVQDSFPDLAGSLSVDSLSQLSETDEDTIRRWETELRDGL